LLIPASELRLAGHYDELADRAEALAGALERTSSPFPFYSTGSPIFVT
jgi:hypothetical protein